MADNLLDEQEPQPDQTLEQLVEEGKADVAKLAKRKYDADMYIKSLERGRDELRADYLKLQQEYNAGPKLQELLDKLAVSQQAQSNSEPPQARDVQQPVVDSAQIESLVSRKFQEYEASQRQAENTKMVREKLREKLGDNYRAIFKQQIENAGLTEDFVNDLARTHPTVVFKTFGLDEPVRRESFQSPSRSNQRIDSFAPKEVQRTWSYYQNLKRNDPTLYHNPKTQVQMHHDRIELGDTFKDGDYSVYGD